MWDEIVGQLADFPTAVVTGVDDTGYPFSLRCKPEPDHSTQTLRLHLPEGTRIRVGPACLLCHRHDEQLWNLKSFLVRGELEVDARGWVLRPRQFVPGAGIGGLMGLLRFVRAGRRRTRRYLEKRNLARPPVPWDRIQAMWSEVKRER
jgi:hypothetical protein